MAVANGMSSRKLLVEEVGLLGCCIPSDFVFLTRAVSGIAGTENDSAPHHSTAAAPSDCYFDRCRRPGGLCCVDVAR